MRVRLIQAVLNDGLSRADACRLLGIKPTTGCLIIRNFLKDKRIFQKPGQEGLESYRLWPRIRLERGQKKSRRQRLAERNRIRGQDSLKIEESSHNALVLPEIKTETEEAILAQPAQTTTEWNLYNHTVDNIQYFWFAYPIQQGQWSYPSI